MQVQKKQKKESILYLVLWIILFLAPLLSTYIEYSSSNSADSFPWHEVWHIWRKYLVFFCVFLIHNYLLAPLLVYRRKRILYYSGVVLLLSVFVAIQCVNKPDIKHPRPRFHQADRPPHMKERPGEPFFMEDGPKHRPDRRPNDMPEMRGPKPLMMEHDVVAVIIFFLMIGMNLGVKYYFRQSQDRERLEKLERENLEQQLEYLKYQINPHFLMNTLNNIHALVDIDSEQAKETIVELSKIMRFVLYEGSKQKVSLRREMIFLDNYIQLMRLRVAEQVDISVDIPQVIPDKDIPPLMMITFVENAFKHGVSYQQHSFIDISIQIADDQLHFHCRNSKVPQGEDRHGGVGLQNVKKRLQLIYGSTYTLDIKDESETYTVDLTLPL
jgi:hypothetical protein